MAQEIEDFVKSLSWDWAMWMPRWVMKKLIGRPNMHHLVIDFPRASEQQWLSELNIFFSVLRNSNKVTVKRVLDVYYHILQTI